MCWRRKVVFIAANVLIVTNAGDGYCGDPKSVVDYCRETGRDVSFAGRAKEFGKMFGGERYRGTAEQNTRLLGVMRVGDIVGDDRVSARRSGDRSNVNRSQVDVSDEFAGWVPARCRAVRQPTEILEVKVVDVIAQGAGDCCGITADCSQVGDDCFIFFNRQNRGCARHDSRLYECRKKWYEISDPCARDAHHGLELESSFSRIRVPMRALHKIGTRLADESDERPWWQGGPSFDIWP